MTENSDPARTGRALVRAARRAALGTLDAESGGPFTSLVSVATGAEGAPLLLLSTLARHTRNLDRDPRASLLIEDLAIADPMAGARVTLVGTLARDEDAASRRRFLARQEKARGYAGFADFSIFRFRIEAAHLVAGFGRIVDLPAGDLMTDVAGAADLLDAEESAVEHMNQDHADAVALYARALGGPVGPWRFDGFDPEGCELSLEGRAIYRRFPERVASAGQLRKVLADMAARARDPAPG